MELPYSCHRRGFLVGGVGAIVGALGPWGPATARGADEEIREKRSETGELLEATRGEGAEALTLRIMRRRIDEGTRATLVLTRGRQTLVTIASENLRKRDERVPHGATIRVRSRQVDYRITIRRRGEAISDENGLPLEPGEITVTLNERTWEGQFDFRSWEPRGLEGAPRLDEIVPPDAREALKEFLPQLEEEKKRYEAKSEGTFSSEPGKPPAPPTKTLKGRLCRMGAWGLGGAVGAACCIFGPILCVAGSVVGGAAASLASDVCPD